MTRVAIIGAGPSGLSQLQAFAHARKNGADVPEVVCFDKQDDWGGLWHYTWRTGTDQYGEPIHGSMYRYLWSNGPKECLEFADYTFDDHFGKPIPSFPPRDVLQDYIIGRVKKSGVRDQIRFNTAVRHVSYGKKSGKFTLTAEHLPDKSQTTEDFDHVVVATGHFSVPNVPHFNGIQTFPGRVLHGHDFRSADEFRGKNLVVVGASYSAEDISLQCHKYGAKSVTISYRTQPMGFDWPDGMKEVPLITNIKGSNVQFKDGSSINADAIILCTGYLHHFPFLEDNLRLTTHNRLNPPGLYKGVFWLDNPKLIYLGMQDQYYTFSMFDAQAWYARDAIMGRIELPSRKAMAAERGKARGPLRGDHLSDGLHQGPGDRDRLSRFRSRHGHRAVQRVGTRQGAQHHRLSQQSVQIALHRHDGPSAPYPLERGHGRQHENLPGDQMRAI